MPISAGPARQLLLALFLSALLNASFFATKTQAQEPPGQIGVSPSMFEFAIGMEPVDKSLQLANMKTKPVRVKVEVYNWTLDENNAIQLLPPDRQSLDQWMLIQPVDFTVEPGKTQTVRFSIRPRSKPEAGEHRAIIYFVEQPDSEKTESASIEMLFRLGVGVYGYAEPVVRKAVIHGVQLARQADSSPEIRIDVENKGNVHSRVQGSFSVWEKRSFPGFAALPQKLLAQGASTRPPEGFIGSGSLDNTPVLAGKRRILKTGLAPLPDGKEYIIAVQGTLDGQKVETALSWSP
ncbi:MAG: fimbria/pilus periplasmic chaperone [bacterium]|nr:fimbria/pilus periplasmic chaperone [bacterium]